MFERVWENRYERYEQAYIAYGVWLGIFWELRCRYGYSVVWVEYSTFGKNSLQTACSSSPPASTDPENRSKVRARSQEIGDFQLQHGCLERSMYGPKTDKMPDMKELSTQPISLFIQDWFLLPETYGYLPPKRYFFKAGQLACGKTS